MSTIPTFIQRPGPYKAPQAKKPTPILSDAAFPALGSGSTKPVLGKTGLDFKKTVMAPQTQVQTQVKTPAPLTKTTNTANTKARKHVFVTRYGDDGPEDYDGPPEEDFDEPYEEEEDEDAEFNADIVSTRRRGDKGIW